MNIKKYRQTKNMTQKDLADAIGVDASIISKYENGSITPPTKRLRDIAFALEVEPNELFSIEVETAEKEAQSQRLQAYFTKAFPRSTDFYVRRLVMLTANGHCELCHCKAPFTDKNGQPYLMVHMLDPEYEGSEPEKNMVALCPNCHAKINVNPSSDDLTKIQEAAKNHIL